jgi:uncharacterized protein (TIGR02266 family)
MVVTENRRRTRYPGEVRVTFRDPQETCTQEFAVNISEDGLFVKTLFPRAIGDIISLRFILPVQSAPLEIKSVVRSVNLKESMGPVGMGVKFLDLDESQKRAILQFVVESQMTKEGY